MSAKLKRQLTGVGRSTLTTETDTNRSITQMMTVYEGIVTEEELLERFDEKLLQFYRFKSVVKDNGSYFKIIPEFTSAECIDRKLVALDDLDLDEDSSIEDQEKAIHVECQSMFL